MGSGSPFNADHPALDAVRLPSFLAAVRRRTRGRLFAAMQHVPFQSQTHLATHPQILPAQQPAGMADAYRLASLSASSVNSGTNAEAGPSSHSQQQSASTSLKRKSSSSGARKKRANGADMGDPEGGGGDSHPKSRDGPKKKKASRACFHCQKAHLTCDDCAYTCFVASMRGSQCGYIPYS